MQSLFYEFIDHLREKQYTSHSLIPRIIQIDFLSMDIHLLPNSWLSQEVYPGLSQKCKIEIFAAKSHSDHCAKCSMLDVWSSPGCTTGTHDLDRTYIIERLERHVTANKMKFSIDNIFNKLRNPWRKTSFFVQCWTSYAN